MDILHAVILGVVEGFTEFLPISSTGHLILISELLGIPDSAFKSSFNIAVQTGAIFAVVALYWRSFLNLQLIRKIAIAFLPTAVIGFTVYPFVKGYLLGNEYVVVVSLFVGGIALILFELFHKEGATAVATSEAISYKQALVIGLFQAIAVIPGVSRSGATILGGLASGISRVAIVEFSFLLAVPTMIAATGLDLIKTQEAISSANLGILAVGMGTSFIVALGALAFLRGFVAKYSFIPFGIYRIVVAALFFFFILG